MNKLQNELRDKVISLFIDKIVKLSNEIKELKEENEILRNNLINCLKNVFVLKDAMSVHMPLSKIFSKQSDRIKSCSVIFCAIIAYPLRKAQSSFPDFAKKITNPRKFAELSAKSLL